MYPMQTILHSNFDVSPGSALGHLISTVILLLLVFGARMFIEIYIRKNVKSLEIRRKWQGNARKGFLLLLLFGLTLIWGDELRTLALSLVALAVAFVVATKELILCVTGSILKSGSRSFEMGDRIQIRDFRGDVMEQSLLATTIMEVGPGKITHQRTGRKIVIPNSMFVSESVINESFTNDFVFHVFTLPFKRSDNWQGAKQALMAAMDRHCGPYMELALQHMQHFKVKHGLEVPSVEPRVTLLLPVADEIHLVARIPVRPAQRSHIEQAILADVLSSLASSAPS